MFHIGHLKMLQYAKGLGDKLVVAVNSDELVERHKGKKCLVSLQERMAIVSAIKVVDVCIPQSATSSTLGKKSALTSSSSGMTGLAKNTTWS
jgi:choline-phosphate cytidylyltransferase/glycerol-3-phosphate cytidylyltransferase